MKRFEVLLNEKAYLVEVTRISSESALVTVNGTPYEIGINEIAAAGIPEMVTVNATPASDTPRAQVEKVGGATTVKAPLPGLILDVKVTVGATVKTGDVLLVIETMKMENNIMSPCTGTVKEVRVSNGDNVNEGTPLVLIGD